MTDLPFDVEVQQRWNPTLVFALRSLPIDDVPKSPGILIEIEGQLPIITDAQLGRGVQDARALALVLVVDVDLARSQVKRLGLGIIIGFPKPDLTVGYETDLASGWGWDQSDKADVVPECTGNADMAHRFHFFQ